MEIRPLPAIEKYLAGSKVPIPRTVGDASGVPPMGEDQIISPLAAFSDCRTPSDVPFGDATTIISVPDPLIPALVPGTIRVDVRVGDGIGTLHINWPIF
jgi:hypothetical protein